MRLTLRSRPMQLTYPADLRNGRGRERATVPYAISHAKLLMAVMVFCLWPSWVFNVFCGKHFSPLFESYVGEDAGHRRAPRMVLI